MLCTHPMFGLKSGRTSWAGLPFVYEKVRIREGVSMDRCTRFLDIFASEVLLNLLLYIFISPSPFNIHCHHIIEPKAGMCAWSGMQNGGNVVQRA